MVLWSFLSFLILFLLIGIASVKRSQKTTEDYLIAGKSVSPLMVGLSAIATNNSGFMFVGMIGLTYTMGLSSIWLMFGWIVGDMIASFLTVNKIQTASRNDKVHSFGGLLSHWHGTDYKYLRILVGVLTVFFLTIYASAQLKAGSKATAALLGWDPVTGIAISAFIILVYSAVGGIRASIWTDVAQSCVMVVGMFLLLISGLKINGSLGNIISQLSVIQPGYLNILPDKTIWGISLFILGWIFGGFAVIGQPHIVIRFMSLDQASHINRMRFYYYGWYTLFYGLTIMVGLLSRLVLPTIQGFDAEMALPSMALQLMPEVLVGLVLAAMFAATMSTADSLVLACCASITRDIYQKKHLSLRVTKLATAVVVFSAVLIAVNGNQTVFKLVLDAWGLLASAFAPLIVIYSLGYKPSEKLAIFMVLIGVLCFLLWPYWDKENLIYAVAPGVFSGLATFGIAIMLKTITKKEERR